MRDVSEFFSQLIADSHNGSNHVQGSFWNDLQMRVAYHQLVENGEEVRRSCEEKAASKSALKESREKFRISDASDFIWSMGMDLKYTYISPSAELLLGWTAEEWRTLRLEDVLTPDSLMKAKKAIGEERSLEGMLEVAPSRTRVLELEHYRMDGASVWLEATTILLRDPQGRLNGFMGISRNRGVDQSGCATDGRGSSHT
jgi:PAS domain S-box-containing protein